MNEARIAALHPGETARWRLASAVVAIGAVILFAGLMAGPTPGSDSAQALRRIDDWRAWYISTNVVDLLGILVLTAGLFTTTRLMAAREAAPATSSLAGLATAAGGALMVVVLVMQSTVEPGVAHRFVQAAGAERANQLAIGQAVLDLESGLFGVALAVEMAGIGAFALALRRGAGPALDRRLLWFGMVAAVLAAPTGIASLIDGLDGLDGLGRLEPILSLVALVWLAVTGGVIYRACRPLRVVRLRDTPRPIFFHGAR